MRYRAAVFDMDGTILNTLDDLCASLNHAMAETGHRGDFTPGEVGGFFGSGAEAAMARALRAEAGLLPALDGSGAEVTPPEFSPEARRVFEVFRAWYPAHCEIHTRPYPGVPELLAELRARGVKTAVVSNKLDAAVQSLCKTHFPDLFDACLGEREPAIRRKPAPDMTTEALRLLGVPPAEAVYIGDSEVDLLTAANAGTDCVAVSWGFRSRDFLAARGAARIAGDPAALLREIL